MPGREEAYAGPLSYCLSSSSLSFSVVIFILLFLAIIIVFRDVGSITKVGGGTWIKGHLGRVSLKGDLGTLSEDKMLNDMIELFA